MNFAHNMLHISKPIHPLVITALVMLQITVMNDALACAACGHTLSQDWGSQGISTTHGLSADLFYSYTNQNQQRYGTGTASTGQISALSAAGQEIEDYTVTRTITLSFNYTGDVWGINVRLPFVQRTHGTYGNTGVWPATTNYLSSSDSSVGDASVTGMYTGFFADKTAGLSAGVKLPTGSTKATFNDGSALDRSLQIGTGSTDLILGGYFTGALWKKYGWFAQGTVQHAVTTQTISGQDFRPGDAHTLTLGIRHAKFGAQFTPMLQLNFIHRSPDGGAAATPADVLTKGPATGGTLVYLSPGAAFRVGGGTSIYGFIQLPVYQNGNSLQLSPRYTLTLGLSHSFQ